MNLLLDTHVFLWWDEDELPKAVVRKIQAASRVYVSAVSAWEVAIKASLGKIAVRASIADAIGDYGFSPLAVTLEHADHLRALPLHHRDPFDRLLIAQAIVEELTIVTRDRWFGRYDVAVVWGE